MLRSALMVLVAYSFAAFAPAAQAQGQSLTQTEDEIARIIGYSYLRGGGIDFLEKLTDTIGGRITGTPGSRQAAELILKALKDAGFDSAHFEEYDLDSSWQHHSISGEVVSPIHRPILIGTYGWVPGTPGPVEVPVIDFGPIGKGDVPIMSAVRGAAVLIDLRSNAVSTSYVGARTVFARRLAKAGAAAMFIISDKPDRMLYTSAFGMYPRAPLPVLSIPAEDAAFLRRLNAREPVKLRLDIQNAFPGPVTERNVVAEIPGPRGSDVVLLTAHFDDWDP